MRFGVSTLGCPGLPLRDVAALLRRHGVGWVQLRCAADEPVHVGIDAGARRAARSLLAGEGIGVLGLATYVHLTDGAPGIEAHLELARDLGAPALRIMPGGDGDDPAPWLAQAAAGLSVAAEAAEGSGVRLLVETHDVFLRGADLVAVFAAAGVPAGGTVGAIWDAMHPWRAGEPTPDTARELGPWLAEVQIKDVASPTHRRPLIPGTGAVPNLPVLDAAAATGFDGPVVLEHEARWHADAEPIDAAIAGSLTLLAPYLPS